MRLLRQKMLISWLNYAKFGSKSQSWFTAAVRATQCRLREAHYLQIILCSWSNSLHRRRLHAVWWVHKALSAGKPSTDMKRNRHAALVWPRVGPSKNKEFLVMTEIKGDLTFTNRGKHLSVTMWISWCSSYIHCFTGFHVVLIWRWKRFQ